MKTSILQLLNVQMDTHKKHLSTEKKLFFSTLSNRHRKATAALSQIAVEGKPFGVQGGFIKMSRNWKKLLKID